MKILIVEDEVRLADALAQLMKEQKYMADAVYDGSDGLACALSGQYDAVVLDVMLPGLNGFEVARRLRLAGNSTPILMLTARDETLSKVNGLDCGADDYMTKPFEPEELLARIRALCRRGSSLVYEEQHFGDLCLNLSSCELSCGPRCVRLGYKEYQVMHLLMSAGRMVTSKEELITRIWGSDSEAEDNNVEAYISFLRKKLLFLQSRVSIATLRKIGYRLEDPAQEERS